MIIYNTGRAFRWCSPQFSHLEIKVISIEIISSSAPLKLPIEELITTALVTRLDNRVVDLRHESHLAMMRVRSQICSLFRQFMKNHQFTEIHTPKLTTISNTSAFSIAERPLYYKEIYDHAKLASNTDVYKQLAVHGGMERVYEVGPVFRNHAGATHRANLTEFTSLDFEMNIMWSYEEVMLLTAQLLEYIFPRIDHNDVEMIRKYYRHEPLQYDTIPMFTHNQVVEMLSLPEQPVTRLLTAHYKSLNDIVKKIYNTDVFIVHQLPVSDDEWIMPNPNGYYNSFLIFIRGVGVGGGGQHIHEHTMVTGPFAEMLRYGSGPLGGICMGLERLTFSVLGLHNIRNVSLFPRDPHRLYP
jgi:aspartyl/asparaginyl-tRNA synthetase